MRVTLSAVLGFLAVGLCVGSITMNWPASPSDWAPASYDVGWGRYALAIALAILALLVYWWPDITRFFKALKRQGGGGEYQRLVSYGIGRKQNKKRKNPWPKRQMC